MPVQIAVQLAPQHADYGAMRDAWHRADQLGADMLFTWDHFYPLSGDPDGKHFEGLTTLASMAEVTEHAQIGGLVFCNSYRNPEYLADAHRTIDHISGGRVILGIGAGWFERDYDEYGYEFGTAPQRLRSLKENLPRMKSRLAQLNPPPVREIPFLIGGSGPKVTLRLVAEHAAYWHAYGDVEDYKQSAAILADHCADVGRDPAEIVHTREVNAPALESAEAFYEAGVRVLTIGLDKETGYDLGPVRELIEWRNSVNAAGR